MTIKLTESQIQKVLDNITKEQFVDFLADDVETGVDWICEFIWNYVDSKTLQDKLLRHIPPIQMELFPINNPLKENK